MAKAMSRKTARNGARAERTPVQWCRPAAAEGALTHTDWIRLGWTLCDWPRWPRRSTRS